jgi:hypothetical protein
MQHARRVRERRNDRDEQQIARVLDRRADHTAEQAPRDQQRDQHERRMPNVEPTAPRHER